MIDSHNYSISLVGTGSRTGELGSPEDGLPDLEVASPPEFGGPGQTWSPEHLFVAAVSSCLMTTFRAIAKGSNLEVVGYTDHATGRLIMDEDRFYRIDSITLRPRIVIIDPEKAGRAERLLEKAERACLISRSIKAKVWVEGTIQALDRVGA